MVNETAQWIVLVVMAFLVLGLLRQVSLLIPGAISDSGPGGPPTNRKAPTQLLDALRRTVPEGPGTVAFVSEGCSACQRLLSDIERNNDDSRDAQPVLIVAHRASGPFRDALDEVGAPVVFDDNGALWAACGVTATPLVLTIDREDQVTTKEITHRVRETA